MGQHCTMLINIDIPKHYIDILGQRMIDLEYATEWETLFYRDSEYRNILITGKNIVWDKFEEEMRLISQIKPSIFSVQIDNQILIRGIEDDFRFHSYKFIREKLVKDYK